MNSNTNTKKQAVRKQGIRQLNADELRNVQGGGNSRYGYGYSRYGYGRRY